MSSLGILVPLLLVMLVAANGALTALPRSLTGPGWSLSLPSIVGLGLAGAQAESAELTGPRTDEVLVQANLHGGVQEARPAEAVPLGETAVGVPLVVDPSAAEAPAVLDRGGELLASGSFQLSVPFRTQKDGDRFQGSNCGPASLGMVLEAFGTHESNADLRVRSHTYQGTVGYRGGTALQHLASAARDFGVEARGLYASGSSFHRWSLDDVRAELAEGRPVVPLVKYRLLPGHETSGVRFDHYIVIYGMDGDRFLYHDPSFDTARQGAALWMSARQLETAMYASIVPGQAVAFGPGRNDRLDVRPV